MENAHKKIIIVDEEDKSGYILSKNLARKGFNVDYLNNGEKAKNKLKTGIYDILIASIKSKKCSGLNLLKFINEKDISTDVIIYTAYGDIESYIKASRLGAIEYINKPATADFFESLINKLSGIGQPQHSTSIETSDRRRHNRYTISEPANVLKRKNKEEVEKFEAIVQNISLSGILLSSRYEFSENQEIEVNLILSGVSVSADSITRRIFTDEDNDEEKKHNFAGLEFLNIPESDYNHFKTYIDSI